MRLCWDNRRAPKRRSMAGDSENSLRESMGIVCTSEKSVPAKFAEVLLPGTRVHKGDASSRLQVSVEPAEDKE